MFNWRYTKWPVGRKALVLQHCSPNWLQALCHQQRWRTYKWLAWLLTSKEASAVSGYSFVPLQQDTCRWGTSHSSCFHVKDRHSLQRTELYTNNSLEGVKLDDSSLHSCYTEQQGYWLQTFRTNLPPSSSRVEESYIFGWKRNVSSKSVEPGTLLLSVTTVKSRTPATQCNNCEEPNSPQKGCINWNFAQCCSFCVLHLKFWEFWTDVQFTEWGQENDRLWLFRGQCYCTTGVTGRVETKQWNGCSISKHSFRHLKPKSTKKKVVCVT